MSLPVHCRTGSSEIFGKKAGYFPRCSLPHRQLRKLERTSPCKLFCSLPHRQLRKLKFADIPGLFSSLPHRQLRKIAILSIANSTSSLPHRQLRNDQSWHHRHKPAFTAAQAAQKRSRGNLLSREWPYCGHSAQRTAPAPTTGVRGTADVAGVGAGPEQQGRCG